MTDNNKIKSAPLKRKLKKISNTSSKKQRESSSVATLPKNRGPVPKIDKDGSDRLLQPQQINNTNATTSPLNDVNDPSTSNAAPSAAESFILVGIGASAGGLESITQFFEELPKYCGMAFVVVQHLDPTRKGLMVELLQRSIQMPVSQAKDSEQVRPDHVYVIPPNKELSILKGKLHLLSPTKPRGLRLPVDVFFRAMAEDRQDRSVAVILSGMGTDGTLGLKAIKEKAGLVLVQDPACAKFDGMPRSAIDTGLADIIATPKEMPGKIISYFKHIPHVVESEAPLEDKTQSALGKIFILLRGRTRHDFSMYKRSTVYRRIERRMGIHHIDKITTYVRFLQETPQELDLLFKELLIGVTSFFRDPAMWDRIRDDVLVPLLTRHGENRPLRAWVSGCSTGEEAYSLAIVFKEAQEKLKLTRRLSMQIFATDLDLDAIEKGRLGVFPANISVDLSPDRLRRFFVQEDNRYRVSKEIREMVIFAQQNIAMDPPFTKLDLICCRNLLIYLNAELQKKLMPLFHYSLNPWGVLFLGSAETIGSFHELFAPLDSKGRIYRRIEDPARNKPVEFPPSFHSHNHNKAAPPSNKKDSDDSSKTSHNFQASAEQLLLQRYAPATVLANEKGDIIFIHGRTGKYLEPAAGKANWNIFAMARDGLRHELCHAFHQSLQKRETVLLKSVTVGTNRGSKLIDVTIQPINEPESLHGSVMIVFTDAATPEGASPMPKGKSTKHPPSNSEIEQLKHELLQAREDAHTIREEMQTSEEEIKSSNEELQSTNEELQSSNEELTTSKEEMQSLNEELQTVNNELQAKLEELSRSNNDMKNLLNSTEIATLFLDNELRIRRFTPPAKRIIKLISSDEGRLVTDIVSDLDYPDLVTDIWEVGRSLIPISKPIQTHDKRWFETRIMPYRTLDDRIDGVVITFSDITAFKKLEMDLRRVHSDIADRERERIIELKDMQRFFELSTSGLLEQASINGTSQKILETAVDMIGANKGSIQVYEKDRMALMIVAAFGFNPEFMDKCRVMTANNNSIYGTALAKQERIVIEDIRIEPNFLEFRPEALSFGFVALQATPIFSSDGQIIGIISTYWSEPHRVIEREKRLLDLYTWLMAKALEYSPGKPNFPW